MLGSALSSSDSAMGLTETGVREAVYEHCDIQGHRRPVNESKGYLTSIVRHLIKHGESSKDDLLAYFNMGYTYEGNADPSVGRYTTATKGRWWDDVAEPQLSRLPLVEQTGEGTWRFSGVNPEAFDDDHLVPLEEVRSRPRTKAEAVLDEQGVGVYSDRRDALLSAWDFLKSTRRASRETLSNRLDDFDVEEISATLSELPGVSREVNEPPEPEEIEVETMADVLEGRELLEQDATVEWVYSSPTDGE